MARNSAKLTGEEGLLCTLRSPRMQIRAFLFLAICLHATLNLRAEEKTLRVLFIGNSFTARHNLSQVVKEMAEAGQPGLKFETTDVIYGGRTLADHWRLGTQLIVDEKKVTREAIQAQLDQLEQTLTEKPNDRYAASARNRLKPFMLHLEENRAPWDIVVLQSYRDDGGESPTRYAQFAPRFAEIAQAQGARVILYETTPMTQNAEALTTPPDRTPVMEKERAIAALANQIDAGVVPMSLVASICQTERPDLTLRFVNDAHLNQTMAYLTACTFYAALFERSPEGLALDAVTDIRYVEDGSGDKTKDRDGGPLKRVFSEKDRADLQRIAWSGWQEFQRLRAGLKHP